MLRRTPVFTALMPQVLGSGLALDQHLLQKVLWAEASNVSFINGRVRRRRPNQLAYAAGSDPVRGIAQLLDSNGVRWIWAASGGDVVRWYGPPMETIITGDPWQEDSGLLYRATFWDIVQLGDWAFLNSEQGKLRKWTPDDGLEEVSDSYEDVVSYRKRYNYLVAFGVGGAKTRIAWSNADDYDTWTPSDENNDADSLSVAEFNTPIRAVAAIGDADMVYAEDQLVQFNYVGQPFLFGYKFKLDGIGACGKMAVCSDGRVNYGVGRNGVWWTDGLSYRYIDEGYLREYLQEEVNWDQQAKIVATRNDVTGCFDFSFPMRESLTPNEGWSFDPRVGSWYRIPYFSMKDERRLFRNPVVGTLDGDIEFEQEADDGLELTLLTKPILAQFQGGTGVKDTGLFDTHMNLKVDEVDVLLKQATGVQMRLGAAQEPVATPAWSAWMDCEVGAKTYLVPKMENGRSLPSGVYHWLEFRSTVDGWALDLQGFSLFANLEGVKRNR